MASPIATWVRTFVPVPLEEGWNLVGYPSEPAYDYIIMITGGIPASILEIRIYDELAPHLLRKANILIDEFIMGHAYWMYSFDGWDWTTP